MHKTRLIASSKWTFGGRPPVRASSFHVFDNRAAIDQLRKREKKIKSRKLNFNFEFYLRLVSYSPILILSTMSLSTKLRSAIEMPHRIAPACPLGPPNSTFASTSTLPSMSLKINGKRIFEKKVFLIKSFVRLRNEKLFSEWIDFLFIEITSERLQGQKGISAATQALSFLSHNLK
jgi:hypothetical protein